jgi:prevent-host-death family protein
MSTVGINEAKATLSRLIDRVSKGEEIIIVRGSKPVAKLVAIGVVKGKRQPGSMKGLKLGPEFFEPLPPEELALWE